VGGDSEAAGLGADSSSGFLLSRAGVRAHQSDWDDSCIDNTVKAHTSSPANARRN